MTAGAGHSCLRRISTGRNACATGMQPPQATGVACKRERWLGARRSRVPTLG